MSTRQTEVVVVEGRKVTLARVEKLGDLFAPMLTLQQKLPRTQA